MKIRPKPQAVPALLSNLPPLPTVIRYYDDFSDSYDQVIDPDRSDEWRIHFDEQAEPWPSSTLMRRSVRS